MISTGMVCSYAHYEEEHMSSTIATKTADIMIELIAINSPSGHEEAFRVDLVQRLHTLGIEMNSDAHGNIWGTLPATSGQETTDAVLLNCHMDTVPNAVNAKPHIVEDVVVTDGQTALGADDKAGIAAILVALGHIIEQKIPHAPIVLLFTVSEETGLEGAKKFDMSQLGPIGYGYTLDAGGEIGTAITSAPSKCDARIVFHGKAAHAGFAPETGISAISLAAKAIDQMQLLRIDAETTANIGTIHGGEVTNIVCDRCEVTLEVRSSTEERVNRHLAHMEFCCIKAVGALGGSYEFTPIPLYPGYAVDPDAPELKIFADACERAQLPFTTAPTGGGSDANIMRNQGIPILTLGIGYQGAHTTTESIPIRALGQLTQLLLELCRSDVKRPSL
jgi:tripeptide aminopeptidase